MLNFWLKVKTVIILYRESFASAINKTLSLNNYLRKGRYRLLLILISNAYENILWWETCQTVSKNKQLKTYGLSEFKLKLIQLLKLLIKSLLFTEQFWPFVSALFELAAHRFKTTFILAKPDCIFNYKVQLCSADAELQFNIIFQLWHGKNRGKNVVLVSLYVLYFTTFAVQVVYHQNHICLYLICGWP